MLQSILIVEDDPDGQALVSHMVGHLNMPHEVVGDAEQALMKLSDEKHGFRAVIIDLGLPGKNGWELLATIRSSPATAHLICIAVTAFHTSRVREDALRYGFDAYFAKPLDITRFVRQLRSLLHLVAN